VEHSSVQEFSEEQALGGSTSDNRYGKTCPINMEPVSEHESEDDTDDDQGLLIDQIALENAQKEAAGDASVSSESLDVRGVGLGVNVSEDMGKAIVPVQSAWMSPLNIAPLTPVVNKENIISEVAPSVMRHKEVSSYYQTLDKVVWPPLPRVEEVDSSGNSPLAGSPDYVVQSLSESPLHESIPLEDENLEVRYSSRTLGVNLRMLWTALPSSQKRGTCKVLVFPLLRLIPSQCCPIWKLYQGFLIWGLIFLITILTLWTFFERWNLLGIVLLKKTPLMLSLLLIYIFKMEMVIKSLCV
jgi:hypothetical protein